MDRPQKITLADLARLTGGRFEGPGETLLAGVCSLDHPRAGHVAMMVDGMKAAWEPGRERPAALIVSRQPEGIDLPLLIHGSPRVAFTIALRSFYPESIVHQGTDPHSMIAPGAFVDDTAWVGPLAVVESGARIGPSAQIWPGCYVGRNAIIGPETRLYPNVVVMHDVKIGSRCIIHPGAVIGSDGFGYTPTDEGNMKVPQIGTVLIGDDVEIGANTTVDRATLDATIIADDVKIDNLVQIAHNVKIGPHTRIAAQAGLSGRVELGARAVVGGQAGFQNGIRVGDGSMIGGQAGVIGDLEPGSKVSGYPARDHRKALRILALQNRLPEMLERIERLERLMSEESGKR